mgnify:CR=1 FL=1
MSTIDSTSIIVQTTTYGITVTSTVAAVVTYNLTGALGGTLTVNSEDEYQLNLNGVTITADQGPAFDLEMGIKVVGDDDSSYGAGKGYIEINGGTIAITTTGSVYEYNSGGTTLSCAPEGIEGKSRVTITGGTIIGIGGVTSQPAVTRNTVVYGSMTAGQTIALKSSSSTVLAFTIPQACATMIISSPDIVTGTSYSVYSGGSVAAYGTGFHGLYLGNLTYTGGSHHLYRLGPQEAGR